VGDDDEGIAAVFDPRPDVDVYIEMARNAGVAITHILKRIFTQTLLAARVSFVRE